MLATLMDHLTLPISRLTGNKTPSSPSSVWMGFGLKGGLFEPRLEPPNIVPIFSGMLFVLTPSVCTSTNLEVKLIHLPKKI